MVSIVGSVEFEVWPNRQDSEITYLLVKTYCAKEITLNCGMSQDLGVQEISPLKSNGTCTPSTMHERIIHWMTVVSWDRRRKSCESNAL